MKSHTEYLTFNVPKRMDFVNITARLEEVVKKSGVQEGLLLCNAMHITASVFKKLRRSTGSMASPRSCRDEILPWLICCVARRAVLLGGLSPALREFRNVLVISSPRPSSVGTRIMKGRP